MNNTTVETMLGAAVILVAAAFFLFAYSMSGAREASGGYRVLAEFDNVEGINIGTDVRLAGIKIGTVTAQSLNPENYQAVVTMMIDPAIKLTDDTSAKVTAEGLLGSKFIALDPGGSEVILKDGERLTSTQGAVDIWSLISQAMFDRAKTGEATPPPDAETPEPPQDSSESPQ